MPRAGRGSPIASISFEGGGVTIPVGGAVGMLAQELANDLEGTLTVNFSDGSSHDYDGVPVWVFLAFESAGSKGSYFNANIRNNY